MFGQKLTAHLLYALLGNAANKLFGFAIIAVLARYVDKVSMGEFFFAVSVTSIVAMLTELGTSRNLAREISLNRTEAAACLARVLYIRLPLLAVALTSTGLCVWLFAPQLLSVFLLTSTYVLVGDLYFAFGAALIAVGAVVKRVATELVGPVVLLAVVVPGTRLGWSFEQILVAHAASSIIVVAITARVTLQIVGRLPRGVEIVAFRRVLTHSLPLFALSVLALVHARLDEIMLAMMTSYEQVASYAASYKLLEVSRFVIRPLGMVLFPVFVAAAAAGDWRKYRAGAGRMLIGVGAVGAAVLIVFVPAAPFIVPVVYGGEYQSSIEIAQILFLAAPALFAGQAALVLANSLYLDRMAILITAIGVIGNAGINLVAIPRWGAIGAAWTTFATETVVALLLVAAVWVCLHRKGREANRLVSLRATHVDAGV